MHKIESIENSLTLEFPENATELSKQQLLDFCKNLLLYQAKQITFKQFKVNIVYAFLNMVRRADLKKEDNQTVTENVNELSKFVDAYFTETKEDGKNKKIIDNLFYVQKLESIIAASQIFHGPTDALFNTKYGEYLKLMHHFTQFAETGKEAELDFLIATIYRPEKDNHDLVKHSVDYDGDIRKQFNSNLTAGYARDIAKLPYHVKFAIYLYVASSQYYIAHCDNLDIGAGASVDLSVLFSKTATTTDKGIGMIGTLYSLAETNVFGTIKDVANQNTYDVLVYLANQTHEANKQKPTANATN